MGCGRDRGARVGGNAGVPGGGVHSRGGGERAIQTLSPVELIVIDDGSSDRTAEIADLPSVLVIRREHRGPAAARNTGLALAQGEYWTIFDADDVMPVERLAHQVACLDGDPSLGIVTGLTEAFVTPGEPRPPHFNPAWNAGPYRGHPGTILARPRGA